MRKSCCKFFDQEQTSDQFKTLNGRDSLPKKEHLIIALGESNY